MRWLTFLAALFLAGAPVTAQVVGDQVQLASSNPSGVPVHPGPDDNSYVRWANGTVGTVVSLTSPRTWVRVEAGTVSGWIVRRYITVIQSDDSEAEDPADEVLTQAVGTWNLEWLSDTRSRGFGETTMGGPSYGPRTNADYERIAGLIRNQLQPAILVLQEINGRPGLTTSVELDRLVGMLGQDWEYVLTASGVNQRVAMLSNSTRAQRNECIEIGVPHEEVNQSDVFSRDPLICRFTLLDRNGGGMNDLLVAGLHLASGQDKRLNHNRAMAILVDSLNLARTQGRLPAGEMDLLVAGDLNASRYGGAVEDFWTDLDQAGFDLETLSPVDGLQYPGTRLRNVPLFPGSKIDYLMASTSTGGLADEIVQMVGQVRHDLITAGFDDFREHVSDHLPVMIRLRVVADDDPNN